MFTRKQYMNKECTFEQYYTEISENLYHFSDNFLSKVKSAIANGDEHLNTIPLSTWSNMAVPINPVVCKRLKDRGDTPTLAGAVCAIKQAAKNACKL